MLTLSGISKAYGGRVLFSDVTLQVNRQDRLGLVGPNGAGKTTLFSLMLGEESADDGKIMTERNVVIGYLPQESTPVATKRSLKSPPTSRPSSPNCGASSKRGNTIIRLKPRIPRTSTTTFTTNTTS